MYWNEDHAKGYFWVKFCRVIFASKSKHDSHAEEDQPHGEGVLYEPVAKASPSESKSHLRYDQAHAYHECEDNHDRIKVLLPKPLNSLNAQHCEHERFYYHKDIKC